MCAEFATNLNIGPPSFAAATEFLQGAGQGQIVQQVSYELYNIMNYIFTMTAEYQSQEVTGWTSMICACLHQLIMNLTMWH